MFNKKGYYFFKEKNTNYVSVIEGNNYDEAVENCKKNLLDQKYFLPEVLDLGFKELFELILVKDLKTLEVIWSKNQILYG